MFDIVVVGAGPIGSFLAGEAAQEGLKVALIEEHPEVGKPAHCTGIVGENVMRNFDFPDDCMIKSIDNFTVFCPDGRTLPFPGHLKIHIVDRVKLDKAYSSRAVYAGARLYLGTQVQSASQDGKKVVLAAEKGSKKINIEGKICVMATGAMSNLPFESGIGRPPHIYKSAQMEAEVQGLEGAEIYTGEKIAPGSFAYAVSVSRDTAKIGLIVKRGGRAFLENLCQSDFLRGRILKVLNTPKYRRIPMGAPKNTVAGRILALGDAACQLKTTSGGGIYYGLLCARILINVLKECRKARDFDLVRLKRYDTLWKDEIGGEIEAGILIRSFFEQVRDKDLNHLMNFLRSPEVQNIIIEKSRYDRHRDLLIALLGFPQMRKWALEMIRKHLKQKRFFASVFKYMDSILFK
ncbi:MAG: NAD(P)/FAD-dependent oxidoreductase [bacterium]